MSSLGGRIRIALTAAAFTMIAASVVEAQAYNYPAFQPPRTTPREFNVGIASGDDWGTSLVFQWREPVGMRTQLSFDAGIGDPDGADAIFFLGGTLGYQLKRSTPDMPLDLLLTAGLNGMFGDIEIFRVPVGVSIGHRFPLEGQLAITPFVHPRLMMEFCGDCGDDNEVGLGFDIGADFEFTPRMSMRLGVVLGGTDYFEDQSAFGISLAWRPSRVTR